MMHAEFLPISSDELAARGWDGLDIVIVTGDAYVDHPSYAAAVIGRVLEDAGFKVGVIAQPDWRTKEGFMKLGRPRLFFGVTAGNLDSMVANFTANRKVRNDDDYSPGGRAGLRPERATIVYTNRIREAYGNVPVVLGGLEASMRRLAHYDYWSDKVRRSVLLDSKADILVYGMGERQSIEIAKRLSGGEPIKSIDDIRGTVVVRNNIDELKGHVSMPSFEAVQSDKDKFNESFKMIYYEADPFKGRTIVQRHGERFVIQNPPAPPLTTAELDKIYGLDYVRTPHPVYDREGGVPGFETVRFSIISHRGCAGQCNFCSLYLHQGRIVQSRSHESIVKEARLISELKDFKGTITDIGGPTANLYMAECPSWKGKGTCTEKRCLVPQKCRNLRLGYERAIKLWRAIRSLPKVKHLFIGSGMRHDLLVDSYSDEYLKELCGHHISGRLKVAPEHSVLAVLKLMGKPAINVYEAFVARFNDMNRRLNKKQFLVNYIISSHPGAGIKEATELAKYLSKLGINPEQIQDYLPLPMTASACMYYTGKDPFSGRPVYVSKGEGERRTQRALIQSKSPANRRHLARKAIDLRRLRVI